MYRSGLILLLALQPLAAAAQQRPQLAGVEAAVVADHPLAVAAGADVLQRGGNAVDAAITMAAVLAVVQPHRNGIGGDAFLLYRQAASGRVFALNGTGRSAERATPEFFRVFDGRSMPDTGVRSVTVPGALRLWSDVLRRHGSLRLDAALQPAIRLADGGFAVTPVLRAEIEAARSRFEADPLLRETFLPNGRPPPAGSVLRQRELAQSLRLIARDGADVLYVGELGQRLAAFMEDEGGLIRLEDLAAHSTLWQEPVGTTYLGHRVLSTPPNSEGLALLLQLNMAESFDLAGMGGETTAYAHTLLEIARLAAQDGTLYATDPAFVEIPTERLVSKEYARSRVAGLIAGGGAGARSNGGNGGGVDGGDAVFLAVIDAQGNAVVMTQSLHSPFGSGRTVPGTGMILQNGASAFSLDAGSPDIVAPGKRPFHALVPAMALRADGSPLLLFGTAGQAQAQLLQQVVDRVLLFGASPQEAVEAGRWRLRGDGAVVVERAVPSVQADGLAELGHPLQWRERFSPELGGVQLILVLANGVRMIGADPRREAWGLAW